MIYKSALLVVLLLGIIGCAGTGGGSAFFTPQNPGMAHVAGGDMQLFFSNPEYSSLDPTNRQELLEMGVFNPRQNGSPFTTGGIGLMQVWRF